MVISAISPMFLHGENTSVSGQYFFAVFPNAKEAINQITAARKELFGLTVKDILFDDEEGFPYTLEDVPKKPGKKESVEDESIQLSKYPKNALLTIQFMDEDGDPIYDNVMLIYHLNKYLNKETK
jgi:hypothetical protein